MEGFIEKLAEVIYEAGAYYVFGNFNVSKDEFIELSKKVESGDHDAFFYHSKKLSLLSFEIDPHNPCYLIKEDMVYAEAILDGVSGVSITEEEEEGIRNVYRWCVAERDRQKSYKHRRLVANTIISNPLVRKRIFERDEHKCCSCGDESTLSIDHVISVRSGGCNEDENLQTLCIKCNSSKGAKDAR